MKIVEWKHGKPLVNMRVADIHSDTVFKGRFRGVPESVWLKVNTGTRNKLVRLEDAQVYHDIDENEIIKEYKLLNTVLTVEEC